MWSLVYPVIKLTYRVLPSGEHTAPALGLQTRLHCFLQILQSGFHDKGGRERWPLLVSVELCFLWPNGEKPGWMGLSWRGPREELLLELSLDGGRTSISTRWGEAEGIPGDGTAWAKKQERRWLVGGTRTSVLFGWTPLAPPLTSSVASGSSHISRL